MCRLWFWIAKIYHKSMAIIQVAMGQISRLMIKQIRKKHHIKLLQEYEYKILLAAIKYYKVRNTVICV